MKKKIATNFFVFEVIRSELVALNCLYQERVHAIGAQCVRKQF